MINKSTFSVCIVGLISALTLAGSASPYSASTQTNDTNQAMGFLISDNDRLPGWYTFPVTDATSPVLISKTAKVSAGTMAADGIYYAQTYSAGPIPAAWNRVDTETGVMTQLSAADDDMPLYVDMTFDHVTDRLLAIYHYDGKSTALCEVNPADGSATTILEIPDRWFAGLACSWEGELYAIANDGFLNCLDPGATEFATVGFVRDDIEYMQSMTFNHADGSLYWACSTATDGYFYRLDTVTGEATLISELGNEGEMTGLYIPGKAAQPDAPGAVSNLHVDNASHDRVINVSATLPLTCADGSKPAVITGVILEIDATVCATAQGNPGETVSFTIETTEGLHRIGVRAVNDAGKGLPCSKKLFVGEDIAAAPRGVTVSVDGNNATISWQPVTSGAHTDSYLDLSSLTYRVIRYPGEKIIAEATKSTSVRDTVGSMQVCIYHVTPVTSHGEGETAVSSPTAIGEAVTLPFVYDFEDVLQMPLWTIIDSNKDGVTWARSMTLEEERTMIMRGNNSINVDDWLISPPLLLEKGRDYKIAYDAGCMNVYYPASYTLTIGRGNTPSEQRKVLKSETTDRRFLNRTYVSIPPVDETGIYYIGFHAEWKPSFASLYISNIAVAENFAATLTGTVTDGKNPVAGASVKFDDKTLITEADGQFAFYEIVPGTYNLSVTAHGFEPMTESLTLEALETKTEDIIMTPIARMTVTGRVTDTDGHPISGASVSIHGYDNYMSVTDRDGYFRTTGVYVSGQYDVDIYALNYEPMSLKIESTTSGTDIGTVALPIKLIAPGDVAVAADREKAIVTWTAPQDREETLRYDDGTDLFVFSMEMSNITEYTATGVIFDTPALFTAVSWDVWNNASEGAPVDVLIFDLDSDGNPTSTLLYERNGIESHNGEWITHRLDYPVVAPRGALVALRGDARICMDSGGENPSYPTLYEKMVFTHDYRTEPFHSHYDYGGYIFRSNLTLRATILPFGAPRARVAAESPAVTVDGYKVWRLDETAQSNPSSWTLLTDNTITDCTYTDTKIATADPGIYRYAVKAVYPDGNESFATISESFSHRLTSAVILQFDTNVPGESAAGARLSLFGKGTTASYSATVGNDNRAVIPDVRTGIYTLTVTKAGFLPVEEEIEVRDNADTEATYTLIETTETPSSLLVEETGNPASRLLRWNVITGVFDDFEGHDDWAINSPGTIGWSYVDGDEANSYSSPNYTYPNANSPIAFIVMNPSATEPSMIERDFLDTFSGDRCLLTWATLNGVPNDDYIISPRIETDRDYVISFMARCYWTRYVETLRVGYSTESTDLDSFTWVDGNININHEEWQQYIVGIPADARYVAINCISENNFYVALDDIFIGDAGNIPARGLARQLRVPGVANDYEVYFDGKLVAETTDNEYLLENLSQGSHIAGVKARYGSGVTEMASVTFDVDLSGGTEDVVNVGVTVTTIPGRVDINGLTQGTTVRVFTPDGRQLSTAPSPAGGTLHIALHHGIYIIDINGKVYKISVP